jgi:tocopherol O-methyltransferase
MDKQTSPGGILTADEKNKGEIGDQYEIPTPEPFISFNALKGRIRHHYEICSDYYYSLW